MTSSLVLLPSSPISLPLFQKCYQQSNFATLTQIILGLQSPWVERLRKTWARIGMWEMRILRDLKSFTSPLRNFRHLRNAIQGMVTQSGMEDLVTSAGPPQTPGTQAYQGQGGSGQAQKARNSQGREVRVSDGCIPFFGECERDGLNQRRGLCLLTSLLSPFSKVSSFLTWLSMTLCLPTSILHALQHQSRETRLVPSLVFQSQTLSIISNFYLLESSLSLSSISTSSESPP